MRIIAGKCKAKRIEGPKTTKTRPTLDRVKEALFSIISNDIKDADVLDLFSGTGNLAIEAVSRGAKFAWLNDRDSTSISTILTNISLTNLSEYVKITKKDYIKCLRQINSDEMKFDIIFLDPPYDSMYAINTLKIISDSKEEYLKKEGIIVYETDKNFVNKIQKKDPNTFNSFENLECFDERSYGGVVLKIYRWR